MTYPKRGFYDHRVDLPIPEGCMAQTDTEAWESQRFDFTGEQSRLIGTRLYRHFRSLPDRDAEYRVPKQDLLDQCFTREEQFAYADKTMVGRHVVNCVRYRRVVFQQRLKGHPVRMCWQFATAEDPTWGVAVQICRWLPDFLRRVVPEEYPDAESITTESMLRELDHIASRPQDEVDALYVWN